MRAACIRAWMDEMHERHFRAGVLARPTPCALACALLLSGPTLAADDETGARRALPEVTITAVHDRSPAHVVTDPRLPRQPLPASDAGDYLRTIPGFSAIRSGGSNSDPVFRGQFGSRLPLLTNGTVMLGACPSRMDAPSAYISPGTFDRLTVIKGPQTVIRGPGASAGVLLFDHERPDFDDAPLHFDGSLLVGSAGRNDQSADLTAGNERIYVRATANRSHSRDYKDGDGHRVPSRWDKWNADLALGLTPDPHTLFEFTIGAGDGEARYGGRGMDGTKFRRDSLGLRFEREYISSWLRRIEAQLYRNEADHVMDNFTLRSFAPGGMMAQPMARDVRRITTGGRLAATLEPATGISLTAGVDFFRSPHELRSGTMMNPYASQPWQRDARFTSTGVFAELAWQVRHDTRWVGGIRLDRARAWRYPTSMAGPGMSSGPSAGERRTRNAMPSGFVRWERTLASGATAYVGLGHVQRFPDYWELVSPGNSAPDKGNAFATLQTEKTTQLDLGINWQGIGWQLWGSTWAGHIRDYVLFDYQSMSSSVRNVDARTAGFELGGIRHLGNGWSAQGTLAWAWGRNSTDGRPLPQMPPLEARLGLDYARGSWGGGVLWRLVAAQHRYATGQGNVAGQDLGGSPGFGVFSVHADYRLDRRLKVAAGIDNLFGRTYAEHLNRAGNAGFGYPGGTRINEPGRTLWLRADLSF